MYFTSKIFSRACLFRDFYNQLKFGSLAPKSYEGILVNPKECVLGIHSKYIANISPNFSSALIVDKWPVERAVPVIDLPRINFCIRHWVKNEKWEKVGAYDRLRKKISNNEISDHDITTEKEIELRYQRLDTIFNQIKKDGKLKKQSELLKGNFREKGGVLIHIGPNGVPYFGLKGNHRFAIAYILNLPIPAQIGLVHKSSVHRIASMRLK
ncbi:hypothetical protein N9H11_04195 [Candidatus Pelagibacter ubique]|nr:hypothetical protein [Candidatus Pelagibacter ubique]